MCLGFAFFGTLSIWFVVFWACIIMALSIWCIEFLSSATVVYTRFTIITSLFIIVTVSACTSDFELLSVCACILGTSLWTGGLFFSVIWATTCSVAVTIHANPVCAICCIWAISWNTLLLLLWVIEFGIAWACIICNTISSNCSCCFTVLSIQAGWNWARLFISCNLREICTSFTGTSCTHPLTVSCACKLFSFTFGVAIFRFDIITTFLTFTVILENFECIALILLALFTVSGILICFSNSWARVNTSSC